MGERDALSGGQTVEAVARKLFENTTIDVIAVEIDVEANGPMKPCKK